MGGERESYAVPICYHQCVSATVAIIHHIFVTVTNAHRAYLLSQMRICYCSKLHGQFLQQK